MRICAALMALPSRSSESMTRMVGLVVMRSSAISSSSSAVADLAERFVVLSMRIQLFDSAAASRTAAIVVIIFWKISCQGREVGGPGTVPY